LAPESVRIWNLFLLNSHIPVVGLKVKPNPNRKANYQNDMINLDFLGER